MINFIKNLFSKKGKIKKFSLTDTKATEGSNRKANLNPEIKSIIKQLNSKNKISNDELNKLISFYFNKTPIEHYLYKLNTNFSNNMCFDIDTINTVINQNNDVEDIVFIMKEKTYGSELSLTISIKDFYDFLKPLKLQPAISERQ